MSNEDLKRIFSDRTELFLRALRSVGNGSNNISCKPVDGSFILGWQFEQGADEEPRKSSGNMEYAISYCEHMIGQGLSVAFSATYGIDSVSILLKAWEEDEEPEWPSGMKPTIICSWFPMTKNEYDELI